MTNTKKFIPAIPLLIALLILTMIPLIPGTAHASAYTDVNTGSWYTDTISRMSELGFLTGYPDGSFRPDSTITGAEFTSVTARADGISPAAQTQTTHWAAPMLQSALDAHFYDYDELPPTGETYDKPITRKLAVSIIMRAFAPDASGDYGTMSAKIKDFSRLDGRYYNTTLAAYAEEIAQGDNLGNFNPDSNLTRAEACALIVRAYDKYGPSDTAGSGTSSQPSDTNNTNTPSSGSGSDTTSDSQNPTAPVTARTGGVSENGQLQVIGTQLCNASGQPIVLHGMSTHGIQWFPQYATADSIKATADAGANLLRIAMYTDEGGYINNPSLKNTVTAAVDAAISQDMYVIIDWHILSDGNPQTHKTQALTFFKEMASRYKDSPAVLYEICNEPNGNVTWQNDIKPYANEIIPAIRAIDDDSVILVGGSTWSQDIDQAAASPLDYKNIMYTCHFYAGTHTDWLRQRISAAMAAGLPVFITEWGTSDASGSGGVYTDESIKWLNFMKTNNISWANWSLCDKSETSAALIPGATPSNGWTQNELTDSGKLVFSYF